MKEYEVTNKEFEFLTISEIGSASSFTILKGYLLPVHE